MNHQEQLNELKRIYEEQEIPAELTDAVNAAIAKANIELSAGPSAEEIMEQKKMKIKKYWKRSLSTAAAVAILTGAFAFSVNTNEAFAATMKDVPILGSLVKVFTAENTDTLDNVAHVDVKVPAVDGIADKAFEKKLNQEIQDKMSAVVTEAKQNAKEDKDAWLATGGIEAEYTPVDIIVDYEVKSISEDTLSFIVSKTQTSASAYFEQYYYNIDLKNSKEIKLSERLKAQFGDDYINVANQQIKAEIAERSKNPENLYFDGTDGVDGFSTITDNQNFYINSDGNVVIEFNKYEIAPGYMGMQDFELK